MRKLRYMLGFGSFFSILVALFIYFYARDNGWTIVKWVALVYLFLTVGIFAIVLAVILIVILFYLITYAFLKIRGKGREPRTKHHTEKDNVVDAEYVEYQPEDKKNDDKKSDDKKKSD